MKQSAENILREYIQFDDINQSEIIELLPLTIIDAMEEYAKQQQGYSEFEVENILLEYVKTNPTKPYRVLSWFVEFKKQIRL